MFDLRPEDCDVWRQHGSDPGWRARHKPTGITISVGPSWQEDRPDDMLGGLQHVVHQQLRHQHMLNESRRHTEAARAVCAAIYRLWPAPKKRKPRYRLMPEGWRPPEIQAAIDEHEARLAKACRTGGDE